MLSKKTVYNQLVTKVNAIDINIPSTSGLVTKTEYDLDKQLLEKKIAAIEKKIPNISRLIWKTDYNTKIESKIPSATGIRNLLNTKATEIEKSNLISPI